MKDAENNIFIYGIVVSSFSTSKKSLWIATGNWSITLKNNTSAFDLNMTWFDNDGSASRTYHIFDFKSFYTESGLLPNNILIINDTTSISLNNHTEYNIPITIYIERNEIMMISEITTLTLNYKNNGQNNLDILFTTFNVFLYKIFVL